MALGSGCSLGEPEIRLGCLLATGPGRLGSFLLLSLSCGQAGYLIPTVGLLGTFDPNVRNFLGRNPMGLQDFFAGGMGMNPVHSKGKTTARNDEHPGSQGQFRLQSHE